MSVTKKGKAYFGSCQDDIHTELSRYAELNEYNIHKFHDVNCKCGNTTFKLYIDNEECVVSRECASCKNLHVMLDGDEYLDDVHFYQAVCTCDSELFELTVGVSLYYNKDGVSDDVKWIYIGCRCPQCNQIGCYADWKNEFSGYSKLLRNA